MKPLPSLIYAAYFHAYLKQETLITDLTDAVELPATQLQEIGYSGVLANQMRPLLDVISGLQHFLIMRDEFMELSGEITGYLEEFQKDLDNNQPAITWPLNVRIYQALVHASQNVYPKVADDLNVFILAHTPTDIYEMKGTEVNACYMAAPLATIDDLPLLFNYLHTLSLLDPDQPEEELKIQVDQILNHIALIF